MIYLDNAATTRIDPEVLDAMMPYLTDQYGNPGAVYAFGREARKAVEKAREQTANLFHCEPSKIVFTSGGSEGNNMVIKGVFEYISRAKLGNKMAVSSIEHDSVLRTADDLAKNGADVVYMQPDATGRITPDAFTDDVCSSEFVSVMFANNETGVVNDIRALSEKYHRLPDPYNIFFDGVKLMHSDCVQAAGNFDIDVKKLGVDFATISSHKIHGPKGVGAVYARLKLPLVPLITGGRDQEFGLRGGTENVPGIVGFGKACELALSRLKETQRHCEQLSRVFLDELKSGCGKENIIINGSPPSHGKTINVRIRGVDTQTLLLMLDDRVCISAGSACCSHSTDPSHVLKAMGVSDDACMESFRVSFSRENTEEEVMAAVRMIVSAAAAIADIDK